jgi:hypothetical protein
MTTDYTTFIQTNDIQLPNYPHHQHMIQFDSVHLLTIVVITNKKQRFKSTITNHSPHHSTSMMADVVVVMVVLFDD